MSIHSPGEMAILCELRRIDRRLSTIEKELGIMDAAGEALKASIEAVNAEESAVHQAVVEAGTKFGELKALIEKQAAGALTDEEAAQLTALSGEVAGHLTSAAEELKTDVAGA